MEWNEKLQSIIDYVENHLQRLQEPIDPREIAEIAGCSFGFFQNGPGRVRSQEHE